MRRVNLTIEIEDNNLVEVAMELELRELLGQSIVSYKKVPDDKELYGNDHKYRELCMKVKAAQRYKYEYYDKNGYGKIISILKEEKHLECIEQEIDRIIEDNYEMDDILEEELTWNTGLTYLRPDKITPNVSFQSIADENNMSNLKRGDFGGFCLAWTLWYAESRLKNPKVEPLILVKKLIKRINNLNIKFVEYIRNYSNKMAIVREDFLEKNLQYLTLIFLYLFLHFLHLNHRKYRSMKH